MAGLEGFRRILFDQRGHGRSGRPRTVEEHRIGEYAADVVALADELGLERLAYVGWSNGARVGYELAALYPDRVAALVAIGTVDPPGEWDAADWRETAASIRAGGVPPLIDALAALDPGLELPEWFRRHLDEDTDREMLALELEAWAEWTGPWALFRRIGAPTLIVAGELEDAGCREAAAQLPMGDAAVLPGLGHLGAFLRSDLVLREALPFLEAATRVWS